MAGIAGIILKDKREQSKMHKGALASMMQNLYFSEFQKRDCFECENCLFGNVVPVTTQSNDHFHFNADLGLVAVIDGLVFIADTEKRRLSEQYGIDTKASDNYLLPFLFDYYGIDFTKHITGFFNIFICNEKTNESFLINDRLGYLPLYYFETEQYFK